MVRGLGRIFIFLGLDTGNIIKIYAFKKRDWHINIDLFLLIMQKIMFVSTSRYIILHTIYITRYVIEFFSL